MKSTDYFTSHPVFTHEEYRVAHGQGRARSRRTADSLLTRAVSSGRLLRVRRGVYASVPGGTRAEEFRVDPYLVACKLAADATIGYHAALQFRGRSYSVWHRFAVITGSHLRAFTFQGCEFVRVAPPRTVSAPPGFGGDIDREAYAGGEVRATTLERTLVDSLDVPALGGGWEEIWRSLELVEYFDLDAVLAYTQTLGSALTAARVGFFLEQHRERFFVEERHLAPLRALAPKQPRYLDTTRETGRYLKAWNLVVPERVLHRAWEEIA